MMRGRGHDALLAMNARRAILIIKLSALGDFVQALAACAMIRRAHAGDTLTVLTTAPYRSLAEACPYFDQVMIDERPKLTNPLAVLRLARRLRAPRFDRVYDLQTADRSTFYFRLMRRWDGGPQWSGIAPGCSHPHANPHRDSMHTLERQAEQLDMAGITPPDPLLPPDLSWVPSPDRALLDALPDRFALLVPGGAPHRPRKRWPASSFGALARRLAASGVTPVLLGTAAEAAEAAQIRQSCPSAIDLLNRTSLLDIAGLGRRAVYALGNDTGPMHLLAAAGCPSVVLFSDASDPALCAPRGPAVTVLRRDDLALLTVDQVWKSIDQRLF
ncbi:glycosyltransferase family 9 protein [Rhodospirillum rubrum]|uniref:glycosyltransferase family 9 protein n=1 Tax=Rhodospirillum rubrum TaxID=1085 RepID=UPI003B8A84C4